MPHLLTWAHKKRGFLSINPCSVVVGNLNHRRNLQKPTRVYSHHHIPQGYECVLNTPMSIY